MRTVELLPDERLDAEVRALWQRLADAGLPSLAAHPHPTNRPHVTLAEAGHLDVPGLGDLLDASLPLACATGALGLWSGRRGVTLHLVVLPSPALVELHRRVNEALTVAGAEPAEHLLPGRWSPHLTLAMRMPAEQVSEAVGALAGHPQLAGDLVAARSYTSGERTVATLTTGRP